MKLWLPAVGAVLLGLIGLSARQIQSEEIDRFPHARHQGLFPSCTPCHGGALTGAADEKHLVSITPEQCAACHDGVTARRVSWSPGTHPPGNLKFSHALHVGRKKIECVTCHRDAGSSDRMAQARPAPETCLPCHTATEHLAAEARCSTCHTGLSESPGLTAGRVGTFPRPPNHETSGWLFEHGALADHDPERCAICHARETCETCHMNAGRVAAIKKLEPDPRVAEQTRRIEPRWPRPADHDAAWPETHGRAARADAASCGNCHGRSSCEGCHGAAGLPEAVRSALPELVANGPRGVELTGTRPPGHDRPEFARDHRAAALSGSPRCETCHDRVEFCGSCHQAPAAPEFHPVNYLNRHAADAYSRDSDCAGCHSTEVFCRTCHENVGLAPGQAKSASYHDAQPFWLLSHGTAAREGLESCASCHQQKDCLRCHSAKSGWGVDPHGPDFEARRLGDRSLLMCSKCHFSNPTP